MKILIISLWFPPCTGGASTLMYNLCRYLPKEHYNVISAQEEFGKTYGKSACDEEYLLNCKTIKLPVRGSKSRDRLKFLLLTIFNGLLLNRIGEVDCLLAVYPDQYDLFAAYVLRRLTRKPLIIYMHDLFSEVRRNAHAYGFWEFVERKIFSSASAILVTNEKFKDHYSRRAIRNLVVLPSCVSLNENDYQAISQSRARSERDLRIVFTGSVYAANEDAILCFLEATRKVSDTEIIFATPYNKDYLEKVSVGFLSKKECSRLQASADVLFLPLAFKSPYPEEIKCAFPIKVLEYLVACKPILAVVPRGSYMEELVRKNEVGIVVTELSERKITEAIEKLRDEQRREVFSKNAKKAALLFDARVQAKRLYSIIEHLV